MIWTADIIAKLRHLRAEGHSTAEIGRRLGISKNAVCGKIGRLKLGGGTSPIRPTDPGDRAQVEEMLRAGRPPLEVSGLTGMSINIVRSIRRDMGLPPLPQTKRLGRVPTDTTAVEDRIQQMRANGIGYGAIAREVRLTEDIVRRVLGRVKNPVPRPTFVLAPLPAIHLVLAPKPVIEAPARAEAPRSPSPVRECCWPIGEPRTKAFRFCGGAAVLGKPYCEGCARRAYTKVRDRDREQAA